MAVVMLDEELKEMADFRYRTLVDLFGKEEADKIIHGDADETADDEELSDELKEVVEFGADSMTGDAE